MNDPAERPPGAAVEGGARPPGGAVETGAGEPDPAGGAVEGGARPPGGAVETGAGAAADPTDGPAGRAGGVVQAGARAAADPAGEPAGWLDGTDPAGGLVETSAGAANDPAGEPAGWLDGTDPAGWADTGGEPDPFPPVLDLDVQPAGGGPWVDPDLLGEPPDGDSGGAPLTPPTDPPAALLADLARADGDPDADWAALRDSDDPAVRALVRRWSP